MICVIIIFTLAISLAAHSDCSSVTGSKSTGSGNDVTTGSFEEKGGSLVTSDKSLKKLVNISMRAVDVEERSSPPFVFRWTDGRREQGDRPAITPWDDYNFNGSKDYEYQLSFRGCRITYIEVRLLIPNNSGYCGYLDGGIQQTSLVLAIGARAIDYFYYGVRIFVKC